MKTCPACGFDPEADDPDAYVANGGRNEEIRRLPSLPSTFRDSWLTADGMRPNDESETDGSSVPS